MFVKDFLLKRRWIILTFSFAVVTLATAGYLIFREIQRPKKSDTILSRYGYLFREVVDMDKLDKVIQSASKLKVNESDISINDTCILTCPDKRFNQNSQYDALIDRSNRLNSSDSSNDTRQNSTTNHDEPKALFLRDEPKYKYSYHGCCISRQEHISPHSLEHATEGTKMRIVQFKKMKQYFLTDICKQAKNCNRNCECKQQMVTAVALVVDSDATDEDFDEIDENNYDEKNARIEFIKYPGWCKCFNKS